MTEITFIGTSDAFGAGGRRQSAILMRTPNCGGVLIDCGMTTGTGLCDLSIERDEIDTILISHFHGDHFGGIPPLLLAALYEDERTKPLRIAGPPGVQRRVFNLAATMCYAIEDRDWSFPIVFEELPAGREIEIGPLRVRSFETRHQPHTHPHGMIIQTGSQRIAYSGDTGWFDELPGHVGDADLFISECTNETTDFEFHLSHKILVEKRDRFDCGRMILTHLGAEMRKAQDRAEFDVADDGMVITI